MRRREFMAATAVMPLAVRGGLAALGSGLPALAAAQAVRRVGILEFQPRGHEQSIMHEFVGAMAKLGYIEGRNVQYLHRSPERFVGTGYNERLGALARDLVRARPDVIVTAGTYPTKAAAGATTTIPIVTNVGDPVGGGFAQSISRPGGNVTGVALSSPEVYEKTLDYLKAIIPGNWTLAITVDEDTHTLQSLIRAVEDAARKRAIPVRTVNFQGMDAAQADRALAALYAEGVRVLSAFATIAGIPDDYVFTTKYRLAIMPSHEILVAKGDLLGYFSVDDDIQLRKAEQVVRILRGTPVGAIPFEKPRKFRLLLNRTAAAALGVAIPPEILLLADQVYD